MRLMRLAGSSLGAIFVGGAAAATVTGFRLTVNNSNSGSSLTENYYGLPRYNHCAFAYNSSLYVFGGSAPANNNNVLPPTIAIRFWASDEIAVKAPTVSDIPIDASSVSEGSSCSVTSSGQAIFLEPQKPAAIFDLQANEWVPMPSLVGSSDAALSSFNETPPRQPRREMVSAMHNDRWIIHGGLVSNQTTNTTADSLHWTASTSTFVLDARTASRWIWYDITSILAPPSSVPGATMVSTQRWVLHISTSASTKGPHYVVSVYCFDPVLLSWLGQVASFDSTTDQVKAAPLNSINGTDSVLFFPAFYKNHNTTSSLKRRQLQQYGTWRLDISIFDAQATVHYNSLAATEYNNDTFQPVSGGSVTRVRDDLVVLYGGLPFSHASFQFWNTSSTTFVHPGWWSSALVPPTTSSSPTCQTSAAAAAASTEQNSQDVSHRNLAIILGTVLGFFCVLALAIIVYLCCFQSRSNKEDQPQQSSSSPPPIINRLTVTTPEEPAATWADQLKRAMASITGSRSAMPPQQPLPRVNTTRLPFTVASPESTTPFNGADTTGQPSPVSPQDSISPNDIERQRRVRKASRFAEHFDTATPTQSPDEEGPSTPR